MSLLLQNDFYFPTLYMSSENALWEYEFLFLLFAIKTSIINICSCLFFSQHMHIKMCRILLHVCHLTASYHSAQVHVPITRPQGDFATRAPGLQSHMAGVAYHCGQMQLHTTHTYAHTHFFLT